METALHLFTFFCTTVGFCQVAYLVIVGILVLITKICRRKVELKYLLRGAEINDLLNRIADLKTEIHEKEQNLVELQERRDNDISELQKEIEILFLSQWDTINMLCREYVEPPTSDKSKIIIANNINRELDKLRSPHSLRQIEETVNRYRDSIVERLRTQCSFLTQEEITFMTLIYGGLSSKAISLIMGLKGRYFYVKRDRILNKIAESDVTDKKDFIKNAQ